MKKIILTIFILIVIVVIAALVVGPSKVDNAQNRIKKHQVYAISEKAQQLHDSLIIGDWHADSLLWSRNLSKRNNIGHVDIPRLQEGNVGLQMFTVVTKSPSNKNYSHTEADGSGDDITKLALGQRWPVATWTSLTARAIHQSNRLHSFEKKNLDDLAIIKSKSDLGAWMEERKSKPKLIGALLGTEGSHALDGDLSNIKVLFDHGFRMMSLQHFFDNKLGGSLHGASESGLTDFGMKAVVEMNQLNIIIDVSHSSKQVVEDVLKISSQPLVVSHTGLKGHCDTKRNIPDALMKKIAQKGGLIAIGYWAAAACGTDPKDIASAIIYGIELVGENHISLGSDFDGSVATGFDASELAVLTQALLDEDISENVIKKVMGANMLQFLQRSLP